MPAAAKGTTEAAAKAFVRHWIDVLNYAGPAGDHGALRELSDEKCEACSAIADFIQDVYADGGRIEGDGWRIRHIRMVSVARREAVVDVDTAVAGQRVWLSSSHDAETFAGGHRLKTFWLSTKGPTWIVTRLDQPQ